MSLLVPMRRCRTILCGRYFQAQNVHRKAMAALALFQEAARQDRLTVEKTLEVPAYLQGAE